MTGGLARDGPRCQGNAVARVSISADFNLGVLDAGGGDKLPIIFLHGVGSDKSVWAPQLAYFRQMRAIIAKSEPSERVVLASLQLVALDSSAIARAKP